MLSGIRTKITIAIASVVCIFTIVLGAAGTRFSQTVIEEQQCTDYVKLNGQMAKTLVKSIEGLDSGISTVSENTNMKEIIAHPDFEPYTVDALRAFCLSNKDVLGVYMATREGRTYSYPKGKVHEDQTATDWYKNASGSDSVVWTSPYEDVESGEAVITGARAVYEGEELIGVVAVDISLDYLNKTVSKMDMAKTGRSYVVSKDTGRVIAGDEGEELSESESGRILEETSMSESGSSIIDGNGNVKKILIYNRIDSLDSVLVTVIDYSEISGATSSIRNIILAFGIAAAAILILAGYIGSGRIILDVILVNEEMKFVENGDFSRKIENIGRNDEIGQLMQSFNSMAQNVKNLIYSASCTSREVTQASQALFAIAQQTSASASEISSAMAQISEGATFQAGELAKVVDISDWLADTIEELSLSGGILMEESDKVIRTDSMGMDMLNELSSQSERTKSSNSQIEKAIARLDQSVQTIYGILDTIASISSQTGMLALNASIEASRAGEYGAGFAVVAQEIRKLAEESDVAAAGIRTILRTTREESKNTVDIMKSVKETYVKQEKAVEDVKCAFAQMSDSVRMSAGRIAETSGRIEELREREREMKSSIDSISQISVHTSAASEQAAESMHEQLSAVEEVSKSAQSLSELALGLKESLSIFRLG